MNIAESLILKIMILEGKTALITGSVYRIGRSIALTLAEQGANIIIHGRKHSKDATSMVNRIRHMGRKAEFSPFDLQDCDGAAQWFESLASPWENVDILVNSACEYREDSYDNLTSTALTSAMAVQVLSPLAMMRSMKQCGRPGTVVNILDTRYCDRDRHHTAYHLAKRGLHTLTRDLAMEYAPSIRVNAVAPGIILPPLNHDEDWLERMKTAVPLGTHGNPEDLCDAVLYLIQASFVTGQVIFVDGGRHLKGNAYGS